MVLEHSKRRKFSYIKFLDRDFLLRVTDITKNNHNNNIQLIIAQVRFIGDVDKSIYIKKTLENLVYEEIISSNAEILDYRFNLYDNSILRTNHQKLLEIINLSKGKIMLLNSKALSPNIFKYIIGPE